MPNFCSHCGKSTTQHHTHPSEVPKAAPKPRKVRRGATPKQKAYGRHFKRLSPQYKKKNGQWKKDGFKRCVKAAHRANR